MRIGAAEVVEVAVLGADELHLQLRVRMAGAAGVDDEVAVGAFGVHVLEADLGAPVPAALGGVFDASMADWILATTSE